MLGAALRWSCAIITCLYLAVAGLVAPGAVTSAPGRGLDAEALDKRQQDIQPRGAVALRIMPLGASITYGLKSSDGNGYRAALRDRLVRMGHLVKMVGSHPGGDMDDIGNEGWPSYLIADVHATARPSVYRYKPNLVLINAGTNDCVRNVTVDAAGARMAALIADVYALSPRATVVLSTLVPNSDAGTQARAEAVNAQYRRLVAELRDDGGRRPIVLAEMAGSGAADSASRTGPGLEDLHGDGIHPTDRGYLMMAMVWHEAVARADTLGLLRAPEDVDGIPDDGRVLYDGLA